MKTWKALAVAAAVAAIAAVVAATAAGAAGSRRAVVRLRTTMLGSVLVDGQGRTLYLFEADKRGRSACYGACASAWPPLLTSGKPHAAGAVRAALLGTTKRKGGARQVTYGGHPLYLFVKDAKPGQAAGEGLDGFGGEWYALGRGGAEVEPRTPEAAPAATPPAAPPAAPAAGSGY